MKGARRKHPPPATVANTEFSSVRFLPPSYPQEAIKAEFPPPAKAGLHRGADNTSSASTVGARSFTTLAKVAKAGLAAARRRTSRQSSHAPRPGGTPLPSLVGSARQPSTRPHPTKKDRVITRVGQCTIVHFLASVVSAGRQTELAKIARIATQIGRCP